MHASSLIRSLVRILPRRLIVLVAETGGFCSIQVPRDETQSRRWRGLSGALSRIQGLRGTSSAAHALFDRDYYVATYPDLQRARVNPLLHYLLWGGFEGRKPHPLFDSGWYMRRYPDVVQSRLNPLQHYARFGWRENRSPHPLFDPDWYVRTYPDVKASRTDPLLHFLRWGATEGRQPHPLFDTRWYLNTYREARESGLNPLVHYVLHGARDRLNPNRNFNAARYLESYPDAAASGLDPLTHYLTAGSASGYDPHPGFPRAAQYRKASHAHPGAGRRLMFAARPSMAAPPEWRNTIADAEIPVFVVYGRSNVGFIESNLFPALAAQNCRRRIRLYALNYRGSQILLSERTLSFSSGSLSGVTDLSSGRADRHIGFGASVNYLFERVAPASCFFVVNPDALPMPGCLDRLLATYLERSGAIVEARQWPAEHPKEFDPETGWTPWASGAFLLISSAAFARLRGFDPVYFLYNEDVDLSWRAWLNEMPVVYEPRALCAHFTGALSYQHNRYYYEQFFGIRNFLVIAYKFFGDEGERAARRWIDEAHLPATFRTAIEESYSALRGNIDRIDRLSAASGAGQIKILGLNLYHELRQI